MIVVHYLVFLTLIGLTGYPLVGSTLKPYRFEENQAVGANRRGPWVDTWLDTLRYAALLICFVLAACWARLMALWIALGCMAAILLVASLSHLWVMAKREAPTPKPITEGWVDRELAVRKMVWPAQSALLLAWLYAWHHLLT